MSERWITVAIIIAVNVVGDALFYELSGNWDGRELFAVVVWVIVCALIMPDRQPPQEKES